MAAKAIRIRIGASVDRNLTTVFPSMETAAKKARKTIETEMNAAFAATTRAANAAGLAVGAGYRENARTAKDSFTKSEAAGKKAAKGIHDAAKQSFRQMSDDAKYSTDQTVRHFARMGVEHGRELAKMERAQARAHLGLMPGPGGRAITASGLTGAAASTARVGLRAASSITSTYARGVGLNLDAASHMQANAGLEQKAMTISNQAYMPGKSGAAGQRQDPTALVKEMQAVGNATATSFDEAMTGLDAFVTKTGDLKTGRDVMMDLARLSKATGADLSNTADAAGDVANALGDVPDKAAMIKNVLAALASQGKEGAVEMKSLASQMAKLGAASSQMGGDPSKNMATIGALVQMTRARGGAASSTQAATSVGSFMATFSKGKRLESFQRYGVRTHEANGMVRGDMQNVILESIRASKGSTTAMGEMFSDVGARRVTRGMETAYNQAGGGAKGEEAALRAFDELARAAMGEKEITDSLNRAMSTQEAQAQLVNNQLQETAAEIQKAFLPALVDATPAIAAMGRAASSFIAMVTGKGDPNVQDFGKGVAAGGKALNFVNKKNKEAAELGLSGDEYMTDEDKQAVAKALKETQTATERQRTIAGDRKAPSLTDRVIGDAVDNSLPGYALGMYTGTMPGADNVNAGQIRYDSAQEGTAAMEKLLEKIHKSIDDSKNEPQKVIIHGDNVVRADNSPSVRTGPPGSK